MSKAPKTLTPEESNQLLHGLLNPKYRGIGQEVPLRNYTMALLMLDAGLRVGELVQLLVSDLYFGDHACYNLIVREEVAKLHKERMIPMTERLKDAVAKMNHQDPIWRNQDRHTFAFYGNHPLEHLSTRRVQQIIESVSLETIGRKITPHVLRHTFGTRLMSRTNIRVVQQLLGHASIQSTQIYTHPNQDDLQKAINSL